MQKNALRSAAVNAEEVPIPCCTRSSIVIANRHSLISAGTETTAVGSTKGDMVKKALGDPDIRQAVVDMVVQDGIKKTNDRIQHEFTKWTPLGYSGAGVAVEVGRDIEGIKPGDVVAYGGENHAEYVRASKNLCVKVPDGVSTREAAFVTVGSIALQAVRRADIQVGETVVVIGLGLIGQLVSQLLDASGARVFGTDMLQSRLELGKAHGLEEAMHAGGDVVEQVLRRTGGLGADRVLICAGTSKNILQQAVSMTRERGQIVVVGGGTLDIPRDQFYMKELDLLISRSYGPGRYDKQYEEHGVDYPFSYVRWTENRNMQEFVRLIKAGKLQIDPLVTHEFDVDQADQGYELLMNDPGNCLGIVLQYDATATPERNPIVLGNKNVASVVGRAPNLAVIGCGAFAQQFHLPNIRDSNQVNFHTLAASTAQSAKEMGLRFKASECTTDTAQLIRNTDVDAVMVFTRDKSHASLCIDALSNEKHVFCEKPLATTEKECDQLSEVASRSDRLCMTGFNRRFAPMLTETKETLSSLQGQKFLHFRVNAGTLPDSSWVFDEAYSAGRIIGEACHFIDLFRWLTESEPVRVTATSLGDCPIPSRIENVSSVIEFADGSIANLLYTADGSKLVGKERLEVFCDGTSILMDDYKQLTMRGARRVDQRVRRADKGHDAEFNHFVEAITGATEPNITFFDGIQATRTCIAIIESARSGNPVSMQESVVR